MPNRVDVDDQPPRPKPIAADDNLQRALARRERFLKHHPHLRAYQKEIDRVLDISGDCHGRMAVLGTLMQGKLLEIKNEFRKLNQCLH
jgi:hypothetical protein